MFWSTVAAMWLAGVPHRIWVLRGTLSTVCWCPAKSLCDKWVAKAKNGFVLKCPGGTSPRHPFYASLLQCLCVYARCLSSIMWDIAVFVRIQLWFMPAFVSLSQMASLPLSLPPSSLPSGISERQLCLVLKRCPCALSLLQGHKTQTHGGHAGCQAVHTKAVLCQQATQCCHCSLIGWS